MRRREISFYLNTGFVIVLVAVLLAVGAVGYAFLHRWAVRNVLDRLEVSLEEAKSLAEARSDRISTILSEIIGYSDIAQAVEDDDTEKLDSFIARLDSDSSTSYNLIVDADGRILASTQENVGGTWALSYLLKPLADYDGILRTNELLPEESVALCSADFRTRVHVEGADDSIPDVDFACLSLCIAPIYGESGTFVGAIVGGYVQNNDHEFAELYTQHVPDTYLSAGTADGVRISSNIQVDDYSFPVGTRQGSPFIDVLDEGKPWRGISAMVDGSEGVVAANPVFNYDGDVIGNIGVGAPVYTIPDLSGATFVIPAVFIVVLFFLASLLANFITRIVTAPIAQLQSITRAVAAEKALPADTEIGGTIVPAEIDSLRSDVLTMAAQITDENARLEKRVSERTMQLDEKIIELRQANQYKSQFLANISHELRTPLNSIIGFASLLKDRIAGPINATQERYTDTIIESGHHLLDLINDIIQLVKVDAGVEKPNMDLLNLPLLIHTTTSSIYPTFNTKLQTLSVEIDDEDDFPVVTWDEKKIRQVLLNLLTNASKFTPDGGKVTVLAKAEEDDTVYLEVADTGIGIADDMKERVFLAFEQADSSYTRLYKGVGLGLAITKEIVELHQGSIWLEDNPGGGTRVCMRMPIEPTVEGQDSGADQDNPDQQEPKEDH